MIQRILFAMKMGWRYRQQLRDFQQKVDLQCSTLVAIDFNQLKSSGVSILAIDFDGVLASHGEDRLSPSVLHWLKASMEFFGEDRVFILSNRPTQQRQKYIKDYLPAIQWVQSARKKPYPDGILQILGKIKALPTSILVIDDRLLTGILAALIVGTQARWITQPYVAIQKRPLQEIFFIFLRWGERLLLR